MVVPGRFQYKRFHSFTDLKSSLKTQHSQKQKKKEKAKKNPRDGANFLSVFFYWWLIDIFRKGKDKQLEENEIYNVVDGLESEQLGDRLERGWTNELLFAMDTSREPRVTNAIWFAFGASFVILTASLVFVEALYICQGLVLYWYVLSSVSREYLLSLCVSSALSILLQHGWNAMAMTVGTQLRVSCHSLLCKKLLKLDANYNRARDINEKMNQVTEGLVLAELAIVKAPYILIGPFYALLVLTMLWAYFDRTAIVGVVIMLIVLIPLIVMSRQVASRLLQLCAPAKRERLFLLEEAASGMFQVKQRCLGQVFQNKIENFRRKECAATDACAILHTMVSTIQAHATNIMTLLSVTLYTLSQQAFSEEEAFLILCLLQTLSNPLCTNLPMGFSLLTKLTRTIQVLQELLVMLDCPEQCKYEASSTPSESKVILVDASAECLSDGPMRLSKISMNVKEGQILAVIGPWKSGKTPLLYLLQGEIQPSSGIVAVKGRTVFCPHTPWLLPAATLRENIVCGKHINEQRLKLVLEVCGLVRDVQELPKGDLTVIGTDGFTLTLQQMSKINLARTLYHESDIYLLDDPFRWLGRQVSDRIFTRCILKLLKDKTVILVTDKHRHIVKSDLIIALKNGKVEGYGTFSQLVNHISMLEQASDLTKDDLDTDSEESDVDEPTNSSSNNKFNIVECSYNYCRRYSYYPHPQSPVMKSATKILPYANVSLPETKPVTVWCQMFPVIAKTRCKFALTMIVLGLIATQVFLTVWDFCFIVGLDSTTNSTWHHLLKSPLSKEDTPLPALWYLSLGAVLVGVVVSYSVARTINKASNSVHDSLVKSFFQAPITLLDQQLLNKMFGCLTQDMKTLDEFLVPAFLSLIQHCLMLIGCLALVVTSYYWFILPTLILGLFTYYVFNTCLPTTKALETIESSLWRPVEAHFVISEDELVTLRSLKASEFYRRQFAEHQDKHTSSLFLLQSATEALSLWLSLACVVFTTCITFAFYLLNVERSIVALATYSCLVMTNMLPFVVADSTSASRLLETAGRMILTGHLPQETAEPPYSSAADNNAFSAEGESIEVTSNLKAWPFNGQVSVVNLTLANNIGTHAALESLQFTIKAKETVGIVGSGKSSLLAALLRLIEPSPGGCIRIDGVDIRDVPVKQLRAKISVVPRHPVLFAGTLRANLDPLNQLTDVQIWDALDKVGLRDVVSILPFGLQTESRHWDKTFTADQRQLLYLALAVISANKIIIVDLASRNTQPESERSLLNLVHEIFPSCTVVIMSERLRLVMATERVLVLESGRMTEYGHPYLLLQNKHSHLNKMIQEAGPSVLKTQLLEIAKNSFINAKRPSIKEESMENIDVISYI